MLEDGGDGQTGPVNKQRLAVEVVYDEKDNIISTGRYILKRSHRPGDTFIRDWKEYRVLESGITECKLGTMLVSKAEKVTITYEGKQ
jgi:hypothetical protein